MTPQMSNDLPSPMPQPGPTPAPEPGPGPSPDPMPDPGPAPRPAPGKDLPNPMPDRPQAQFAEDMDKDTEDDIPAPLKDDKAGQTAIDERNGKTVRGWENIDEKGHERGHGDEEDERQGTKGQ